MPAGYTGWLTKHTSIAIQDRSLACLIDGCLPSHGVHREGVLERSHGPSGLHSQSGNNFPAAGQCLRKKLIADWK